MVITSVAFLQGWEAVCNGTRTGGPWGHPEQGMHIICLELLAATLAVKTFLKNLTGMTVLLQLDNQTAVACINKWGHSISPTHTSSQGPVDVGFSQGYHSDCRVHSRGSECGGRCQIQIRTDWKLHPELFLQINQKWGPTAGGSVCISFVHPTTLLFQPETRPIGGGNRCIQPAMQTLHGV